METGLIIGAAGFVGKYLIKELYAKKMKVYATKLPYEQLLSPYAQICDLNILDRQKIATCLFEIRPDYIFHLAAQSSVGEAWKNPTKTVDVNVKGSINVLDAVRELYYKPRILLVGSGEEYGCIRPNEIPIAEESILRPSNIYAATKACQNMIGSIYSSAYDMEIIMVRAFNHIGPGQGASFVVSDFCKQVAEIEKGRCLPKIMVGNLSSKRDFTDVRDVVKAYTMLVQKGKAGEVYNVGSGKAMSIQKILDIILSMTKKEIQIEINKNKIRPLDVPIIKADITKLNQLAGWKPQIPIEQTIYEILEFWRENT